ncbi:cytochrome B561 [Thiohalobacter thiocyanaticus]|uniref:Cytochrome B561 n=1 Tax=Thiohalobacter thiocyanaticus TaxID=585455 RepID=A0A1Z4VU66_9GAMM|nr:cytochrome b/b6 domain-containing protein [Thiohalobacter thiocyanaticus]BAZ94942.1 cytochrome B561 [Thiohalobacter thiocyanaticus]
MQSDTIKVWDPLVRVFHWTLVLAFFTAYLTEDDWLDLHTLAGYTVLGLVAFRLLWGLIGTRHARFGDFVKRPHEVLTYIKEVLTLHPRRYLGHNPAGGLMIVLLLASLLATTGFGLAVYAAEEGAGPLAGMLIGVSESTGHLFEEVHEFFANFTLFLVAVHVAGVIVESLLHGENLVRSMVTGRKPAP